MIKKGDKFKLNIYEEFILDDGRLFYPGYEIWEVIKTEPDTVLKCYEFNAEMTFTKGMWGCLEDLVANGKIMALASLEKPLLPQEKSSSCLHTRKVLYISPLSRELNYYYCKDCEEKL